jgi:phospholipase/carboxylesterase
MASRPLTGQRLAPLQGPATSLVVLVHGYGADGNDLISLAGEWQDLLPTTEFVAPNAPERVPGAPGGFQWFALTRRDPEEMARGVRSAAPVLEEFIKAEEARLGLTREAVALVGFSQGTMLSLEVGLNRPVAAIVGFSGLLAAPPPANMAAAPPILLAHGSADPVIPAGAMLAAASVLGAAGALVQWHLAEGMGHGIDPAGLDLAGQFLALAFAGRLARSGEARCLLR